MAFNFFRSTDIAIDLGNTNTVLSDNSRVLLSQPSYVVLDPESQAVRAVGELAYNMFEKNPETLLPVKPLKGGVIADYDSAIKMIKQMVTDISPRRSLFSGYNNIISGIPYYATSVEQQALRDALGQFNSRRMYMVYEPLAAALGIGLDITTPEGKMVVDIGGGITEIVIISLSGIAAFQSVKAAGDMFDVEIQDYFRRMYNMAIGIKTAEQVKISVGAVVDKLSEPPAPMQVRGKDLIRGIPVTRTIGYQEVAHILDKFIVSIENAVIQTLETCPPELAADIYQGGIHLTGGNALLRGMRERFERRMNLPVHIDPQPLLSVSRGVAQTMGNTKRYNSILME
ncbi:rod shape-determining protein [Chryseolinea sp. T2]|uniref:rod shape-determining protein n=1 Tax=Chryseolinea sp. T2 TaxID=3129255 RepID=UPI0030783AA1